MEHYQNNVAFHHPDGSVHFLYNMQQIATDAVTQVTETLGYFLVFVPTWNRLNILNKPDLISSPSAKIFSLFCPWTGL